MSKHNKHETDGRTQGTDSAGFDAGQAAGRDAAQAASQAAGAEAAPSDAAGMQDASGQGPKIFQARPSQETAGSAERDARIAELEGEVASLKDQYLRKLADYENFRKRMFREKEDSVQYANTQLLTDLTSILDDFERAIKSTEQSRDFKALHDGVDMIRTNMVATLKNKYGLARIETAGALFDPNVHEALMSHPGDCEEPTISEEFQAGYKLKERVLRPAKVKVMMPGGSTSGQQGADSASKEER
ncbi:MAG TPA: nucleotide exchange factor GrpE [Spirochaetales bacterium]|nr:nucleotide exchange factor GrpE [Spirochaetales bacterium]